MSIFTAAILIGTGLFLVWCVVDFIADWCERNRPNTYRRDVLPPPSHHCQRTHRLAEPN